MLYVLTSVLIISVLMFLVFHLMRKKYRIFYYEFYISASLFDVIVETENEVNKKAIYYFFSRKPYFCDKKNISIIRQADKLFYLYIRFYDEEKMILFREEIEKYKEIFPFWVVFPNNFYGAPRWNQGYQEQYRDVFLKYWNTLSNKEQEEYMNKYNCPTEWCEWLGDYKKTLLN